MRTLADHIAGRSMADLLEAGDPIANRLIERGGVLLFRCRCRRDVFPDMMVDLDDPSVPSAARVSHTVRARAIRQLQAIDDRRFACDGCITAWIRQGVITRDTYRAAIGAPPQPAGSRAEW